jgi:hypothetical protein
MQETETELIRLGSAGHPTVAEPAPSGVRTTAEHEPNLRRQPNGHQIHHAPRPMPGNLEAELRTLSCRERNPKPPSPPSIRAPEEKAWEIQTQRPQRFNESEPDDTSCGAGRISPYPRPHSKDAETGGFLFLEFVYQIWFLKY